MDFGSRATAATNYVNRKNAPAISVYFINDDNKNPAHKLSCMFCKRTIADDVKGTIDKIIDTPQPADDFDLAINIQCKLCGQKWRILRPHQ